MLPSFIKKHCVQRDRPHDGATDITQIKSVKTVEDLRWKLFVLDGRSSACK